MGRDSNIYGADDTGLASRISSDALSGGNGEDIWGDYNDSRSQSYSNVGRESLGPTDPNANVVDGNMAGGGDSEKMLSKYPQMGRFPRHVPGPKTSSDEGGGIKTPPPRNQTARKQGGNPKP